MTAPGKRSAQGVNLAKPPAAATTTTTTAAAGATVVADAEAAERQANAILEDLRLRRAAVEQDLDLVAIEIAAASSAMVIDGGEAGSDRFHQATRRRAELKVQAEVFDSEVLPSAEIVAARATESRLEAVKTAAYDHARDLAAAAASLVEIEYPKIARQFLILIRAVAEADRAVQAANRALPVGLAPLHQPEAIARDRRPVEAQILDEVLVERWAWLGTGAMLPDDRQTAVHPTSGGNGILPPAHNSSHQNGQPVILRQYRKVTSVPPQGHCRGARLADMSVPALRGGDPPFWDPQYKDVFGGCSRALDPTLQSPRSGPGPQVSFLPLEEAGSGPAAGLP